MHQFDAKGGRFFIPIEKALLFRTSARAENPEGRSILRNAYLPWDRKTKIEIIEAIGVERDLVGIPIAWVPAEIASAAAGTKQREIYDKWRQMVTRVRRDEQEGLVLPLEYDPDTGAKRYDFTLLAPAALGRTTPTRSSLAMTTAS